jgi:hypothetical protein
MGARTQWMIRSMAHHSPDQPPTWLDLVGTVRKAIVSGLIAGGVALTQLLVVSGGGLNSITLVGWITVGTAMLTGGGLTWAVPNKVLSSFTLRPHPPLQIEAKKDDGEAVPLRP